MAEETPATLPPFKPVGLDIGSCYSRLAMANFVLHPKGTSAEIKSSVVSTSNGIRYIPSLAIADPADVDKVIVGEVAKSLLMKTKSSKDNNGEVVAAVSIHKALDSPTTTQFFSEVLSMAKGAVGENSRLRTVISVPPTLTAATVTSLVAAVTAGFALTSADSAVMATIAEPAAVCLAHGLEKFPRTWSKGLVVSWGSSGLNLTTINRVGASDLITVGATTSDESCNGEAIISAVVTHCANLFQRKNKLDVFDSKKAVGRLRLACEDAVRTLVKGAAVSIEIDGLVDGVDLKVPLSKPRFEMLVGDIVGKAREALEKAGKFDVVLKSGSVCMMPALVNMVAEIFEGAWLGQSNVPADEAAVMGAAYHASMLTEADQCDEYRNNEVTKEVSVVKGLSIGIGKMNGEAVEGAVAVLGDGSAVDCWAEGRVEFEEEGGVVGVVDMKSGKVLAKIGENAKGRASVFLKATKEGGIKVRCGDAEAVIA